jgi:hypothetical protein
MKTETTSPNATNPMNDLRAPIELSWKVQNKMGTDKLNMVAYIDSRDVQNRLDEVLGLSGWQNKYVSHAGKLFCELSIKIGDEWITKSDAGMDSQIASDKGAASDAFKRAAVMFGIGRYIYELPNLIINAGQYKGKDYPVDDKGKILWNKEMVSTYCNSKMEVVQ